MRNFEFAVVALRIQVVFLSWLSWRYVVYICGSQTVTNVDTLDKVNFCLDKKR